MKVAIVHDWLVNFGGAERIVLELHKLYPNAPIYTSVYDKRKMEKYFSDADIRTSFIQKLPFAIKKYRNYLPLMPIAFEQFNLNEYDLVISSSSCCAKGANVNANTLHICYCHTPMRYAWDMYNNYCHGNFIKKVIIANQIHKIRQWDKVSADRVDYFIANSKYVAKRINKHYRKDAEVIYPAIRKEFFNTNLNFQNENGKYLIVSRFVEYKKIDIVINAFNELKLPLEVVGDGPERNKLQKIAKNNITFSGYLSESELIKKYENCKAFVFVAEEDFGMVMAEAQAMGKPVVAYKKGGASEIVVDKKTGILFESQTKESLMEAILNMENNYKKFNAKDIRENAEKFMDKEFEEKIKNFIKGKLSEE